ncbi:glycosyl hydrolase family 28-related protein [Bacillus sp. V5-8f]|uniref:glycosyl hydrolase family 28-related protein n=1 Tax=Bacillus sp. V5-8f TaxID=2053044 RepID=UPI000C77D145|nr:glycosyl hydrolase family 28-related protein [Bacillus sp. V5-8f]PLT35739.1 hypothetical protein CUU64_00205 [Bacillus sp. V5-8f]
MNTKKWVIAVLFFGLVVSVSSFFPVKTMAATVINVKDFGAKGDGKTDDTNAIQLALWEGEGKQVLIPRGTYRISYLTIPYNVSIIGTSAVLKANQPISYVLKVEGSNVKIQGLVIDGNNQSIQGVSIGANLNDISITKSVVQNITQDIKFKNQIPVGIRLDGNTSNVLLDAVQVKNINGKYNIGNAKQAAGLFIAPSRADLSPGQNILIKNSTFTGIGPRSNSDGILVRGFTQPAGITIENNSFTRVRDRAIRILSPGVTVKRNRIVNSFKGNNPGIVAANNQFDMTSGIYIGADNVTADGNIINGLGSYFAAIEVTGASNVTLKNNTLSNGSNYTNSDLIRVNTASAGANAKATLYNLTISKNTLRNGLNGIRLTSGVENFISTDNVYDNCR